MFRTLRISAFALVAMLAVALAESSQVVAEGFLIPQEEQVLTLVNQARVERGLPQLASNDGLRTIARRQAQAMAAAGYIFHTADLAGAASGESLAWSLVGENVGVGPTVELIQQAFLASPHHLENIVDPAFNALGVGATAGAAGMLYVSQDFATLRGVAAPKPAAPKPAATAAPARTAPPVKTASPARAAAQVAATVTPVATQVVTPAPRPLDVAPARDIGLTLDNYPAGAPAGATPVSATRPTLPRTIAAMFGDFLVRIAFWK